MYKNLEKIIRRDRFTKYRILFWNSSLKSHKTLSRTTFNDIESNIVNFSITTKIDEFKLSTLLTTHNEKAL